MQFLASQQKHSNCIVQFCVTEKNKLDFNIIIQIFEQTREKSAGTKKHLQNTWLGFAYLWDFKERETIYSGNYRDTKFSE